MFRDENIYACYDNFHKCNYCAGMKIVIFTIFVFSNVEVAMPSQPYLFYQA
jgi:hypothetical protein